MNELQIFKNPKFGQVRTVLVNDEPYFVGKDVAEILGYSNTRKALADHVDDEDKGVTKCATLGGAQEMTVINESGLYSLILGSKLPTAKQFKRWVTRDVLPSIRKHGVYALDEVISNPDMLIAALTELKSEREQRKALEYKAELDKPKVLFADAVAASKSSILVGQLAKLIRQNGVDIGQNRLFDWMRINGYLIRQKGNNYNLPTQRAMDMGLFEIKESTHLNSDGVSVTTRTPKITGKGQKYFINKFLGEKIA